MRACKESPFPNRTARAGSRAQDEHPSSRGQHSAKDKQGCRGKAGFSPHPWSRCPCLGQPLREHEVTASEILGHDYRVPSGDLFLLSTGEWGGIRVPIVQQAEPQWLWMPRENPMFSDSGSSF